MYALNLIHRISRFWTAKKFQKNDEKIIAINKITLFNHVFNMQYAVNMHVKFFLLTILLLYLMNPNKHCRIYG